MYIGDGICDCVFINILALMSLLLFTYYLLLHKYYYFYVWLYIVAPQIAPFDFGDEAANVGEVAGVQCMVAKGDLPLDIFWSLNSVPIVSGERSFLISRLNARTSALNIDSLDAKHRGVYQCIARNRAGFSEHQSELHVNGNRKNY